MRLIKLGAILKGLYTYFKGTLIQKNLQYNCNLYKAWFYSSPNNADIIIKICTFKTFAVLSNFCSLRKWRKTHEKQEFKRHVLVQYLGTFTIFSNKYFCDRLVFSLKANWILLKYLFKFTYFFCVIFKGFSPISLFVSNIFANGIAILK